MKTQINLSPFRINHYSQNGEDGVMEVLLQIAGIRNGYLVEFGAWDGVYLSNTYYHFEQNRNFKSLLIESDARRFKEMESFVGYQRSLLLNLEVGTSGPNSLNSIFRQYSIQNIALLSIDVDGEDMNLWKSIDKTIIQPAFVIIENGEWQQPAKLDEMVDCFEKDGYILVCVTGNFIFAHRGLGIKSKHNVHELMASSGHPDYNLYYGHITKQMYDRTVDKLKRDKTCYALLAGQQIIQY